MRNLLIIGAAALAACASDEEANLSSLEGNEAETAQALADDVTTEMPRSGPGSTTMQLAAAGIDESLPAEASEEGLPNTEASVEPEAEWLTKLIAASGDLRVRVGGGEPIVVPISDPLTSLIRDCRR